MIGDTRCCTENFEGKDMIRRTSERYTAVSTMVRIVYRLSDSAEPVPELGVNIDCYRVDPVDLTRGVTSVSTILGMRGAEGVPWLKGCMYILPETSSEGETCCQYGLLAPPPFIHHGLLRGLHPQPPLLHRNLFSPPPLLLLPSSLVLLD